MILATNNNNQPTTYPSSGITNSKLPPTTYTSNIGSNSSGTRVGSNIPLPSTTTNISSTAFSYNPSTAF